jgi:RNA polymerase sigma factor (TIGR02999 family)
MGEITTLIARGRGGDEAALDELLPRIYEHLRALARRALAAERGTHTIDTTALVHEAWFDLAGKAGTFQDRAHYFGYAATAMRHNLVDQARRRGAARRSGEVVPLEVGLQEPTGDKPAAEVLALDAALERLEALEPRAARVVELRFFGGLSIDETADALGIVPRTVVRDWTRARAFLHAALA